MKKAAASLRLALAVALFALSLLTVFSAPVYLLWKLSVPATEWAHFLALGALLLVLPGFTRTRASRFAAFFSFVALVLFVTPMVRAIPVAGAVGEALVGFKPKTSPDAPALLKPLRVSALASMPASPDVRMSTITYASRAGTGLDLDLYRRNGSRPPEPLVVILHPGSWMGGTRRDLPALNSYLAARGYVVASPSYSLAPEFRHPAQSQDVSAAIAYLKSNAAKLGIDDTRIAIIGRSAGGQLALIAAYTSGDPSIRGVVAFYAPTDQKWGWENPTNPRVYDSFKTLRSYLGGSPAENAEGYRTSSPLTYAGARGVPTLLIHGSKDELVSIRQSARLDSALTAAGAPHLFIEMPWATHGCDWVFNGPCGQISTYAIERFLASVLR